MAVCLGSREMADERETLFADGDLSVQSLASLLPCVTFALSTSNRISSAWWVSCLLGVNIPCTEEVTRKTAREKLNDGYGNNYSFHYHMCVSVLQLTTFFYIKELAYNPAHKWYYASNMQPEECLLVKCFDSLTDGTARCTPHSAFTTEQDEGPARESIEVRCIVIWDWDITTHDWLMRNTIDLHDCHLFRFERLYCMYQVMTTTRFNLYTMVPPANLLLPEETLHVPLFSFP